jgi:hypothetical protein
VNQEPNEEHAMEITIINKSLKDLTIDVQLMWNIRRVIIPVITGPTGTISKSFRKYLSNILGQHEVKELQKTAIFVTTRVLHKVLM